MPCECTLGGFPESARLMPPSLDLVLIGPTLRAGEAVAVQ